MALNPNRIANSHAAHGLTGSPAHVQHTVYWIFVFLIKFDGQRLECSIRIKAHHHRHIPLFTLHFMEA